MDFAELWRYRDLLIVLAQRDVKLRYRQTALGVIWVVFQPLLAALIFTILFNQIAKMPTEVPYFPFAFAGFMAYNSFTSTLTKASNSMVQNTQMVSKIFFPRVILPLSVIYGTLVDLAVSSIIFFGLMIFFHLPLTLSLITAPLWLLLIQILAVGFGLITSAIMVQYRDIQYALPVLIQFGTYATPVGYSLTHAMNQLPSQWSPFFILNPLSGLLDSFRWSLMGTHVYNWGLCISSALGAIVIFIIGLAYFHRMETRFADVI
ncbi:ABC transporter permease [Armatimonas sp.]|uniref:ABC transporter permease n=1 Tax=Armatimonas sp. TaxID=1872638 RepID=UPI00286B2F20|nr:ABC transporter permease [Armatimonas sp.]